MKLASLVAVGLLSSTTAAMLIANPALAGQCEKNNRVDPVYSDHCSRKDLDASYKAISSADKKYAGPVGGVPGYVFNVITIRHGIYGSGHDNSQPAHRSFSMSQIRSVPFGVYTSLQECDIARAKKIAELDAGDSRFPHLPPGAQAITTHFSDGSSSTGYDTESTERKDVTFCEPGIYSPGSSPDDKIAKLGKTQ